MRYEKFIRSGPLQVVHLPALLQNQLDPTGKARHFLASLDSKRAVTPMPDYLTIRKREQWLSLYLHERAKYPLHPKYIEYDDEHVSKFAGQGGSFPLVEVHQHYEKSYALAQRPISCRHILKGRDYLMLLIEELTSQYGYPQIGYQIGTCNTSAALPTMAKKGTFVAETVGMCSHRHVAPVLPGQRVQRTKHRVINQDANPNVREVEGILAACRDWLRTYIPEFFGSWLNPVKWVHPTITRHLQNPKNVSIETDFDAYDDHFSWALVSEVLLPIYELLIPDKMEFMRFAIFVEEFFKQPVFMGSYMMTGMHNLFSGQSPTNDFETLCTIALSLGATLASGLDPWNFDYLANGDDLAILRASDTDSVRIMDTMMEDGELAGLEWSRTKCHREAGSVRYLRRFYALGCGPLYPSDGGRYPTYLKGAYPGVLTVNSIVNPEYRGSKEPDQQLGSLLQRLDNTEGNPMSQALIAMIGSRVKLQQKPTLEVLRETILMRDWWSRVYNEDWTLQSSYSWRVLGKLSLQHKLVKF